jgi:2C-methyl-D-erythritol 2,4-cyclodiphosphate synthase
VIEEHDHEYRTGIGTDIHLVAEERRLMLGGVYIPDADGLYGHSDGDVGLHAVIDALLGAGGMGDIGTLFPDTDPRWRDDLIIHAEEPRLEPFKGQIKRCIASLLGMDFTAVNIKAKTNEGLGDIGAGEAIAATAIALIKRKYKRTL